MYNKKNVFRIQSFTFNIIFAARTKDDFDKWIENFNKLNKETEFKKLSIMKSKNIDPHDRSQTNSKDPH